MIEKILLQVAGDLLASLEHGEHVDETKHLHFERLIAHAPVEDLLIPPSKVKHRGRFGLQMRKNLPADYFSLLFELVGKRHVSTILPSVAACGHPVHSLT